MGIEDLRGEIIDTLWDAIDYINTGPVCPEELESRIRSLLDHLVD